MKKLNSLAKEINSLLLSNPTIQEYLTLKKEIESDENIVLLRQKLDCLRKDICNNKDKDSDEYYFLLDKYNNDFRIKKYNKLKREIEEYFVEISDILSLK